MTGQEQRQQTPTSAFNERADTAASALKGELSKKLGIDLPERKVEVGPDGKPPRPLPPEGSYARQAIDEQRTQARSQRPPEREPDQESLPASGEPEEQTSREPDGVSDRAQHRISELVALLREKDRELQQVQAASTASQQELLERMEAMQGQYETLVKQNLDNLDPETRVEVLTSAAIQEAVQKSEQKILATLTPHLQRLQQRDAQWELERVAQRYPGFDAAEHVPLIQAFRERNPNCSIEQAFRAVATPEEIAGRQSVPSPAVPPTVAPGGNHQPRYMPDESQKSDPVREMQEEAAMARDLARSSDPAKRKQAQALFAKNIADRLAGRLPS